MRSKILTIFISTIISLAVFELGLRVYVSKNPKLNQKISERIFSYPDLHPYYGHFDNSPRKVMPMKKTDPKEFYILILGGSTAAGTGASSEYNKIWFLMEKYLNSHNKFKNISKFIIYSNAHHGFHTAQTKNLLVDHLVNNDDVDLLISIDGYNNLGRPLENAAYDLPLYYPGWYWISYHRLIEKEKYHSVMSLGHDLLGMKFMLFKVFETIRLQKKYTDLKDQCLESISEKLTEMTSDEKKEIFKKSAVLYKKDIFFMHNIAEKYGLKSIFVLHPLLGYKKDDLSSFEKNFLKSSLIYDYLRCPVQIWFEGFDMLAEQGNLAKSEGVTFLDYTDVFNDIKESPFDNFMHMNDLGQNIFTEKLSKYVIKYIEENFQHSK